MSNAEIVAFLQWALPRLQMRWQGFRRVRRQVLRRINMWLGVWCVGCASGEEAYTITIGWEVRIRTRAPPLDLSVVASDADAHMVERARAAEYPPSSLRELPQEWRCQAFDARDDTYRLCAPYRRSVTVRHEDVRKAMPDGPFDLIRCRNFVFTYYEEALQRRLLQEMACRLVPDGGLFLGHHEALPKGAPTFTRWDAGRAMYRRTDEECAEGEGIT